MKVSGVESTSQTGLLVDYEVEDYGETASFYLPDNQILSNQIDDRRGRSGMPKEYVYKTGKSFEWSLYDEDVELQKRIVNAFVTRFDDFRKQGRGLYIVSKTKGSGKTLLACCIANEILKHHDISVKFISMAEYIELVRDRSEEKVEKINSLLEASLLIVDDIGEQAEDKDWISSAIFRLVNRRYENLLPTIYTSNVPIEQLKCDPRAVSRIYEVSIKLVMPENSIRRKKADEQNATFLRSVLGQEESKEKPIF